MTEASMILDIADLAARQLRDCDACTPGTIFAEQLSINEEQAYAIQLEVCRLREQRGESVVGYKVGCTSPGIRQQLEIDHPVFGRLLDSQRWPSETTLPLKQFSGLAIEGELAVQLASDLSDVELSAATLLEAVDSVFPVIELHNLVFRRGQPSAEELIANNAIHAGFVHPVNFASTSNLDPGELRIEINGVEVATVSELELASTVVDSLAWLEAELRRLGSGLKAGQVILCGSVADLIPVSGGCRIAVVTDHLGAVECAIDEEARYPAEGESA